MKTDTPHILCVNPWIHDFAAYDFWARPLGLLSMAAVLRQNRIRVNFLDCLDRFHPAGATPGKTRWDGRGPFEKTPIPLPPAMAEHLPGETKTFCRYGTPRQHIEKDLERLASGRRPDLILVTSLMTYWASGVAETIATLKTYLPDVPVVLGGIYATLCRDHAVRFSGADHVVSGPGEAVLPELIQRFTGFEMTRLPDPGDLDSWPFPALDLQHRMAYAPILTSRGCPFSCEYCASSFLEPGLRRRSPGHVAKEIFHWHNTFDVKNFAFYDDALLVDPEHYAFPMLEEIIAAGLDLNFHTPNALHIREITPKAANLMFRAGFKSVRLGLETTDFSPLRLHDAKVRKNEFYRAVDSLRQAGFSRDQLGAYLLCGLPGQNLDHVEASIRQVKAAGILPVLAYYTPIPHTPMWEDAVQNARIDITAHPGLTNNSLFPCVRSGADIDRIFRLKKMQN